MLAHGDGDWVWPDNGDGEEGKVGKVRRYEKKRERLWKYSGLEMRWVGCLVC